jgi:uroporphyrin-III C-methyltransferase/precorrin-2 dehydrogenase/sirohydrochlorin ferrochelatase
MNPYPLGLLLGGRRVLVVGGGSVATRRIPALLDAGADVVLVAPVLTPALHDLASKGRLVWHPAGSNPMDGAGWSIVPSTIRPPRRVSAAADTAGLLCAGRRPVRGQRWTPATTRHGPVTVGVTAGGDHRRAMVVRDSVAALPPRPTRPRPVEADRGGPGRWRPGRPGADHGGVAGCNPRPTSSWSTGSPRPAPGRTAARVEVVDASKIPYGPARTQEEIRR